MKTNKYFLLSSLCLLTIGGMMAFREAAGARFITCVQGATKIALNTGKQVLVLKKAPLMLHFDLRKYTDGGASQVMQIACVTDKNIYDSVLTGKKIESISCFYQGTAMSTDPNRQYPHLCVNNDGHHYIYYSDLDKRAKYIKKLDKGLIELQWSLVDISLNEKILPLKPKTKMPKIYIIGICDKNGNGIIDLHEYTKAEISFVDK